MKQRTDALLKTLPDERQSVIADYLLNHSLVDTRKWLAADGLNTSLRALSEFLSWYQLRSVFRKNETDTINFLEFVKQEVPDLPPEKITAIGESYFNLQAIKQSDPETYLALQSAKHKATMDRLRFDQKERKLKLDERRVSLLEKKAAQADAAQQVLSEPLTPEQQQQRLRQIFGMT